MTQESQTRDKVLSATEGSGIAEFPAPVAGANSQLWWDKNDVDRVAAGGGKIVEDEDARECSSESLGTEIKGSGEG